MYLSTSQLFEQLVEGKTITLTLDSKDQFNSIYGSLRTIKSRNNRRYMAYFGEELIANQVVKATYDSINKCALFSLTANKKKTQWQVVKVILPSDTTKASGSS